MKQRYTIPYKGLPQGLSEFDWRVGPDFWSSHPEGGITAGEVDVHAAFEKGSTGTMRLDLSITGVVVVPCDRCLEECELPVDYHERLAVRLSSEEHPFEGGIVWVNPADGEIDLGQYIYESVVLSLPLRRIHPEDVHGVPLCNPGMLSRFRIVSAEEFEQLENGAEEKTSKDDRWAKLKELKK